MIKSSINYIKSNFWVVSASYSKDENLSKGISKVSKWHLINWNKAEEIVKDLQERIVIATLNNNRKEVYSLQYGNQSLERFRIKIPEFKKKLRKKR